MTSNFWTVLQTFSTEDQTMSRRLPETFSQDSKFFHILLVASHHEQTELTVSDKR
jgi:hypothetical protein